MTDHKPSVLFVCVHNAGRSQMAAALLRHWAGERIDVRYLRGRPRIIDAMMVSWISGVPPPISSDGISK
jgi:Low molecular weight phosphotyrosine protein phosphatase